jgi:hypothetical protein
VVGVCEKSCPAMNSSGRYDSTHQATACREIARKARDGKAFGRCVSCSATRTISRTRTTISASDSPRSCSAATVAFTERRSVLMKANSPSSSLETKSSGCAASTIGFFVERLGGENGVARSAGMLPHNGSRSDMRAGGNVPHMIIDEPVTKSKWSLTNKGFCNYGGWLRLAAVGCILAIPIHAVGCLDSETAQPHSGSNHSALALDNASAAKRQDVKSRGMDSIEQEVGSKLARFEPRGERGFGAPRPGASTRIRLQRVIERGFRSPRRKNDNRAAQG